MPLYRRKKTYLIVSVLLLLFLDSTIELRASTAGNYILLSNERTFAEQVKQKDAMYDIRYDFDLKNATVTIPAGSTLRFSGGQLRNGTVNLNGCYIEGNAFFNCKITGCPSNEDIYTRWFTDKDTELMVLLRNFCGCWYNDKTQIVKRNNKRVIHVEKGTYSVTEGLDLRYEQDLIIDFGGSTIIDNIDTYDKLRHRCSPVIAMRESSRIEIRNCEYRIGDQKGKKNTGGMFIEIGGPHVTTVEPNHDILIHNINGTTNTAKGESFIPFSVLGNCYNIEIGNINWEGECSSLINLESALAPITGKEAKNKYGSKNWPYPDYYGLMPYNVRIHDVNGYDRPNAKYGYIRTAGAYNVDIKNVYCRNVMEVIELFQGDAGNVRSAMIITVSNVSSSWGEEMTKPNYAVSVNITRKNPQSTTPNLENADIAMIRFIDCDFQDNAKGNPNDHYLIRVFGNNGMTVFSNCRMRNTQRAVRITDIINTSLLKHVTKFESCLFKDCVVGVDCQNAIVSVQDCIFDTNNGQENQIKYSVNGLSAETLANNGAMLNAERNLFRSKGVITSPYVNVSSATMLSKNIRLNVSRNIFNNTKSVSAIKSKNVVLDAENNIGEKVFEK